MHYEMIWDQSTSSIKQDEEERRNQYKRVLLKDHI